MDPAIVGAASATGGALIAFAGVALTSWRTSKREVRARLFIERRKVYSDVTRLVSNVDVTAWRVLQNITRKLDVGESVDYLINESRIDEEFMVAVAEAIVLGGDNVQEKLSDLVHAFADLQDAVSMILANGGLHSGENENEVAKVESSLLKLDVGLNNFLTAIRAELGVSS